MVSSPPGRPSHAREARRRGSPGCRRRPRCGRRSAAGTGIPAGRLGEIGRLAGDGVERRASPLRRRGSGTAAKQAPACRDAGGVRTTALAGPDSMIRPAYITAMTSQFCATTPTSCETRIIAMPVSSLSSASRVRIWSWMVTSSAVVGSSARSSSGSRRDRHRDHHALPHAAAELVRIEGKPLPRRGDADMRQEFDRALARRRAVEPGLDAERLGDLVADGEHRIEAGRRVLEDHRDFAAANSGESRAGRGREGRVPSTSRLPPTISPG